VQNTGLAGRTILLVEDEMLIAMDITRALLGVGAVVLRAASLGQAKQLVEAAGLSAAVLDFGLPDGHANGLCARLNERDIPYVLHSGYTHLGDECHRGVVIPKPAAPNTIIDALVTTLRRPQ